MNELVQQYQNYLANLGAPTWMQSPLALFSLVCGMGVLAIILRMVLKRKPAPATAAQATAGQTTRSQSTRPQREQPTGVFGPLTDALAKQIPESEKEHREFGAMLRQAGLYSPTARASVYAFRFLFMTFPLLVAGILAVSSPPEQTWRIMIGGGIVAMALSIAPRMYVWVRRRSRLREINNGLADMLDMLSMCLGGGMPLSASLDHVARNLTSYPALGEELLIMKRQSEVGSLKLALSDWANRVDTPEVRQVATLLTRGDQLGTQLGGTLLDQADHFRTSRKAYATMLANRTPVFLTFPLMFCFAPAVLILLMTPAFMELSAFFHPTNGENPLMNNGTIDTGRIVETIGSLDQTLNIPAARAPGADE